MTKSSKWVQKKNAPRRTLGWKEKVQEELEGGEESTGSIERRRNQRRRVRDAI